jgi:hypothetical protein
MWRLSFELAKKNYPNTPICLITDTKSAGLFRDFDFSDVSTALDGIPDFQKIWSLGKIYAYREAASKGPFLHLDADVFLWEPLPVTLTQSPIFVQSPDKRIFDDPGYISFEEVLNNNGRLPEAWEEILLSEENFPTVNMGIFGGTDTGLILDYCKFVLDMLEDPKYLRLWQNPNVNTCLACMVEQLNLVYFARQRGVELNYLLDDVDDSTKKSYLKYTHLMNGKDDPVVMGAISQRVRQKPYNLDPQYVGPKQW